METMILYWIALMSIIGFILMGFDKQRAIHKEWRIRERTLWLVALFGGGIGSYIGMRIFRHKTKHTSFVFGLPAIAIVYACISLVIY
ncbi:DUF1294 domain-containing protein [Viridibacillus sp. YIM B01967]|uniref:DUF1294 domain-containing protein n=1 Tax=Viridibacillus soli TaxID=2798301 RepID=A0ABS1H2C0_9BACL|nr:DUF1294 domain-containing protein [Viridibacillus soli]MBK3493554.1 DUF1294 domain-containing protein [Viridibacillus soli]